MHGACQIREVIFPDISVTSTVFSPIQYRPWAYPFVYKALIIWEILPCLAGAGYLPRSRCYGQTIVKLNLILYEEN